MFAMGCSPPLFYQPIKARILVVLGNNGSGYLVVGIVFQKINRIYKNCIKSTSDYNIIFNIVSAVILAVAFIYIAFKFMGASITVFGTKIDLGAIIYVFIVIFIIFVLGG